MFGELQKVNRQVNVKHWEKEELDTKYIIYKICICMYVYIHVNFQLKYESGHVCAQNIKPKVLFLLVVVMKLGNNVSVRIMFYFK